MGILGDTYGLYAQNRDQWLMDPGMRGDVTDVPSIRELVRRARTKLGEVDLYTSDAGIDVSEDYAGQERLTARLNLGQIVVGLMALRVGGTLVTKMFTFVHPYTLSVIGVCASLFNTLYVTKPKTSRVTNSEIYLVGIGFRGLTAEAGEFLQNAVKNFNFGAPLFPLGTLGAHHTLVSLHGAAVQIFQNQQAVALRQILALFETHTSIDKIRRGEED